VPFAARLAAFGDRVALRTPERTITYAGLAELVARRAADLGTTRRLVLLAGANRVEPLVTYLAALSAGHPVILVPGDNPGNLAGVVEAYDPDVVVDPDGGLTERRPGTAHDLHPELALLLSTSGSTGSPKLVRLSTDNVQANAESIAEYLAIRPSDVAATTLPMHYCYGLSVIHSHLLAGASLMLTSLSVVDGCFWEQFRAAGATTFAAVPYTFDLLDRVGFESMDLPSLRYVTQAGGRLAPDRVRRFAELGRRRGWDLFVMYGQTEATARMAYLPPDLALTSPGSIGIPVPGGSFHLEPLPEMPLSRSDGSSGSDGSGGSRAEVGEHDRRTPEQVAVDDREAVAVVHRQRRRRDVGGPDAEVGGDRRGVRLEVLGGEPDQLGGAGGAGGGQQQRQLGVEVVGAAGTPLEQVPVGADHDVGVVRVDGRGEVPRVVAGCEDDGVAGGEGGEVGHQGVEPVRPGEEHQPTDASEGLRPLRDEAGEPGIGDGAPGRVHRDAVPERSETLHERHGTHTRPGPDTGRHAGTGQAGGRTKGSSLHPATLLGKPYLMQKRV